MAMTYKNRILQSLNAASGALVFPAMGLSLSLQETGLRVALWLGLAACTMACMAVASLVGTARPPSSRVACMAAGAAILGVASWAASIGPGLSTWHSLLAWTLTVCLAAAGGLLSAFGSLSALE